MMNYSTGYSEESPCMFCKHRVEDTMLYDGYDADYIFDACGEDAPSEFFMSDWGCWRFEEIEKEEEDDDL